MTIQQLSQSLQPLYDAGEARAVVRLLLEDGFQMSRADQLAGGLDALSVEQKGQLDKMMSRLQAGEPIQYIMGSATFCGRSFHVDSSVLIPRPETEELARLICHDHNRPYCGLCPPAPLQVLDVGTGSGCIAVTLALDLWNAELTAWDISAEALFVARENAQRCDAKVNFQLQDALLPPQDRQRWDIIVSNPPYIADEERAAMEPRVLRHEPHIALFVPNDDPLRFYRAIAEYGVEALKPGGELYFEINPRFHKDLLLMLQTQGYQDILTHKDLQDKSRMVLAKRPKQPQIPH